MYANAVRNIIISTAAVRRWIPRGPQSPTAAAQVLRSSAREAITSYPGTSKNNGGLYVVGVCGESVQLHGSLSVAAPGFRNIVGVGLKDRGASKRLQEHTNHDHSGILLSRGETISVA